MRIGKSAVLHAGGQRRIDEVVEFAVHETAKAERMVDRHPPIIVVQVFVHVDQHHVAAIEPLAIDPLSQDRELIDRSNWQYQGRLMFVCLKKKKHVEKGQHEVHGELLAVFNVIRAAQADEHEPTDRKSTRLNYSHVNIS